MSQIDTPPQFFLQRRPSRARHSKQGDSHLYVCGFWRVRPEGEKHTKQAGCSISVGVHGLERAVELAARRASRHVLVGMTPQQIVAHIMNKPVVESGVSRSNLTP
jgi:hypothetical protein